MHIRSVICEKRKVNITERRRNGDWMTLNGHWNVPAIQSTEWWLKGDWMAPFSFHGTVAFRLVFALYVCLSVCVSVCLSVYVSVSVCLYVCLLVWLFFLSSVCLFICHSLSPVFCLCLFYFPSLLSIYLSIHLSVSVCLSFICLSIYFFFYLSISSIYLSFSLSFLSVYLRLFLLNPPFFAEILPICMTHYPIQATSYISFSLSLTSLSIIYTLSFIDFFHVVPTGALGFS